MFLLLLHTYQDGPIFPHNKQDETKVSQSLKTGDSWCDDYFYVSARLGHSAELLDQIPD